MRSAVFAGTVAAMVACAFFPWGALAQGSLEERRACTPDAIRLCREFIPDPGKIAACLIARKAQLSDLCRPFVLGTAKPAVASAAAEGARPKKDDAAKDRRTVRKAVRLRGPHVIHANRVTRVKFVRVNRQAKFEVRGQKKGTW
jgi:hypothetical protein